MASKRRIRQCLECPSEAILTDFSLGRLPADRIEGVARHVDTCVTCLNALDALEDIADSLLSDLQAYHHRDEPRDDDLAGQIQLAEQIGKLVWRREQAGRAPAAACYPGEAVKGGNT